MCKKCQLTKQVMQVDAELDSTMNIPVAAVQLREIRKEMVAIPGMERQVFDLDIARAFMQPYLIEPPFMPVE